MKLIVFLACSIFALVAWLFLLGILPTPLNWIFFGLTGFIVAVFVVAIFFLPTAIGLHELVLSSFVGRGLSRVLTALRGQTWILTFLPSDFVRQRKTTFHAESTDPATLLEDWKKFRSVVEDTQWGKVICSSVIVAIASFCLAANYFREHRDEWLPSIEPRERIEETNLGKENLGS